MYEYLDFARVHDDNGFFSRKLQEIDDENGKLSVSLDELQKAFDSTKRDANILSETVSKLETEKAEGAAKLICLQSENNRMKEELNNLKVTIYISLSIKSNCYGITGWGYIHDIIFYGIFTVLTGQNR